MEEVIRNLEERQKQYYEKLEEMEEQIKNIDQALAALQEKVGQLVSLEVDTSSKIWAQTPWP